MGIKMKVIHVLSSRIYSGAENVACCIIKAFEECNIKMQYVSPGGDIQEVLQEQNISYIPIKKISFFELKKVLKEQKPDLIHAHDMKAAFFSMVSKGNIPLVSHIHNNNFDSRIFSLKSILFYATGRKSKHIFWVSQSSLNGFFFSRYLKNKSTVLYNVINEKEIYKNMELDTQNYQFDIVFLGRLTYIKNPQRFLSLCKQIYEKAGKISVAVIGAGDLEAELKQQTNNFGMTDIITFYGYRNNPFKILRDSKVMLMTSRTEGTPMSVLESMALGTPIVSTPAGGVCEVVQHGKTGFISENDEELAEYIFKIITDPELRNRMSDACRIRSKEINSLEKYRSKIYKVYLDAVKTI